MLDGMLSFFSGFGQMKTFFKIRKVVKDVKKYIYALFVVVYITL